MAEPHIACPRCNGYLYAGDEPGWLRCLNCGRTYEMTTLSRLKPQGAARTFG